MEGVTILNTITEEIHSGSLLGFGCIMGILLVVLGIIIIILHIVDPSNDDPPIIFFVASIILGIFLTVSAYPNYGLVTGFNYTYEVIIDDEVNLKEFNEKYNIISQRGEIYTVEEKERS